MYFKGLSELLNESGDTFPQRSKLKILRGRTLTRTPTWIKAAVLVEVAGKPQLRLCGWQLRKEGEWRLTQKFNIKQSYANKVAEILEAYAQGWD
ncbi:MAG: hypothetical protein ACFFDP_11010 [Promethearchaeota archaeon]